MATATSIFATAGKTGVHVYETLKINKVAQEQREEELLLKHGLVFPGRRLDRKAGRWACEEMAPTSPLCSSSE